MKIKSLHIQNFRGFEDVKIEFPDTNLAVFIGENGSGKSSVLDCIGIFLDAFIHAGFKHNSESQATIITSFKSAKQDDYTTQNIFKNTNLKELEFTLNDINHKVLESKNEFIFEYKSKRFELNNKIIKDKEKHRDFYYSDLGVGITEKIKNDPNYSIPILLFYQTNRIWEENTVSSKKNQYLFKQFNAYANAFSNHLTVFEDFFEWFKNEEDYERDTKLKNNDLAYVNPKLEAIRKALNIFLSNFPSSQFSNLRIERQRIDNGFEFNSKNIDIYLAISKNDETFRFEQLSSGEKMLMMMVADIARRLTIANPSLEGEAALQGAGIVLIDEIELHLHPSWQREVIPALRATFPNIQFLITTHSPQVLSGIKKSDENSIFILKDFNIYKPSSNPIGRDSNGILEEIMGVSKRPQAIQDLIDNFFATLNKGLFEESEAIKESLATKLSFDDPFFIQAEATLKRKMILGK